jgi:hypothetical protein
VLVVLVVLVDYCGSAGRRGVAVSRASAAPLVVRLGVVRSCPAVAAPLSVGGGAVVLGSGSVESGPVVLVEVVRWWAQFLHAIGLVRGVEVVSGQTVKGFTYEVLCT